MLFEKIQLEPDEKILTTVRKHWFIIISELFGIFIMILLPFILLFGLTIIPNDTLLANIDLSHHTALIIYLISFWLLLALMAGFAIWTHYFLDLWIVTDRRIIVVDQIQFFNRNVSIFRLERLQDIEFVVNGIIPTLLNFGTIKAQTAGAHESNFATHGLPDPRNLQATIQKAMDERLTVLHRYPDLDI
ncbi:PH domain-containing protein [Candidatus Kaiserbacteria bacterium]|nr:PH domain-containing protein [Candidatus Kaiserbacteria bacterium]